MDDLSRELGRVPVDVIVFEHMGASSKSSQSEGPPNHTSGPVHPFPAGELMPPHRRIAAVLDHLSIKRAHFAAGLASELLPLVDSAEHRVASLTLVNPNRLETSSLAGLGNRLTLITGSDGLPSKVVGQGAPSLPDARLLRFDGYYTTTWTDVVQENTDAVVDALVSRDGDGGVTILPAQGEVAGEIEGVSFHACGSGQALVLLPLLLSPSQWESALDVLARTFRVIVLGGAHLGMVAMLESRGSEPGYQRAVGAVFDELNPGPGQSILEIGCGTGVLTRWIAHRTRRHNPIIATDLNRFFLAEARVLADREGFGELVFLKADAERLPFADGEFDIAFSSTVMEECDADRMLKEMVRVVNPGGRVGVIVRAIDMSNVCTIPVDASILERVLTPYQSVIEHGCADASLYRRFLSNGLEDLRFFPHFLTLRDPYGAAWAYRESYFLAQFNESETQAWIAAKSAAIDDGSFLFASGLHCAVGTKPGDGK